jgi:hypothetical protein
MICALALVAGVYLVVLHRADGGEVFVNPAQVVNLHSPVPGGVGRHFTGVARCALGLSDGKWLSVVEACAEVRRLLEAAGR